MQRTVKDLYLELNHVLNHDHLVFGELLIQPLSFLNQGATIQGNKHFFLNFCPPNKNPGCLPGSLHDHFDAILVWALLNIGLFQRAQGICWSMVNMTKHEKCWKE